MTRSDHDPNHGRAFDSDSGAGGDCGSEPGASGDGGSSGSMPGRDLIRVLIEEQARTQRCRACGRMLQDCTVAVRAATPDRLDAAITCGACGATMLVTALPTGGEGTAQID